MLPSCTSHFYAYMYCSVNRLQDSYLAPIVAGTTLHLFLVLPKTHMPPSAELLPCCTPEHVVRESHIRNAGSLKIKLTPVLEESYFLL